MSMYELPDDLENLLIGDAMGILDADDQARLNSILATHPELHAHREKTDRLLTPLRAWTTPPTPPGLANKVMARIDEAIEAESVETIQFDPRPQHVGAGRSSLVSSLMSLREVVAVAAAILVIVGVFVPSYYGVGTDKTQGLATDQSGLFDQSGAPYDTNSHLPAVPASWMPAAPLPRDRYEERDEFDTLRQMILDGKLPAKGTYRITIRRRIPITANPSTMLAGDGSSALPSSQGESHEAKTDAHRHALQLIDGTSQ